MSSGDVCNQCGGKGRIRAQQGFFTVERTCQICHGTGVADGTTSSDWTDAGPTPSDSPSPSRSGYVYLLHVTAGLLKIGHTKRHPEDRADEWRLELLAYARCPDSAKAERELHQRFSAHRKGSYEIFEMSFARALAALEEVAGGKATVLRSP